MKFIGFATFVTVLSISLVSCATFSYEPVASSTIEVKHDRGTSFPIFRGQGIAMIVQPIYYNSNSGKHILLKITMKNLREKMISIQDIDFSVSSSPDQTSWRKLKVFRSKEFLSNEKAAFTTGAVFKAIGAGFEAAGAGQRTSTTTGSIYGNNGYGTYTETTTTYDPEAVAAVNRRNAEEMAEYTKSGQQLISELEKNLFYSKDLTPNEEYYGVVLAEDDSSKYLRIELQNTELEVISIVYERVKD